MSELQMTYDNGDKFRWQDSKYMYADGLKNRIDILK